ncbi:MAG: Crp/Fnr family transcriptional regulator [Tissierellia bacterium]|nr:Crp/Fnr family transcriptional regulator [Tissierellia bacterium]
MDKAILKKFFSDLKEEDLEHIIDCIGYKVVNLNANTLLKIEPGLTMGLIVNGTVDRISIDICGNKTIERRYLKDDIFAYDPDMTYETMLVSKDKSQVITLHAEHIYDYKKRKCMVRTLFMEYIIKVLNDELNYLSFKTKIYSQKSLREKILAFLSKEIEISGQNRIKLIYNRDDFASFLACNRSALSRELSRMDSEGIIKIDSNCIELM